MFKQCRFERTIDHRNIIDLSMFQLKIKGNVFSLERVGIEIGL